METLSVQLGACDLHTHSTASDGLNTPSENVELAKVLGLSAIAITDHDTVAGVQEGLDQGEKANITVVPGIEISTFMNGTDIHVLGYFINHRSPQLLERLEGLRSVRDKRNELILENLNRLGLNVTMEEVRSGMKRDRGSEESVGRPHIADVLVAKGYVSDIRDAFTRYLAEGAAAYASVPRITPLEAFTWIREAGGAPVIAHPGLYGNNELVISLIQAGKPAGLEVYHSDHRPEEEEKYKQMAEKWGLIATGGSDYHGIRQGTAFHGEMGGRTVDTGVLQRLKEVCNGG